MNCQQKEINSLKKNNNGERLEDHVLYHVSIFGIEQFPNKRIYISSTQKWSFSIFLKKKRMIP